MSFVRGPRLTFSTLLLIVIVAVVRHRSDGLRACRPNEHARFHEPARRPRTDRGTATRRAGEGYDEQPMPGLDSEALDFEPLRVVRHRPQAARRDLETLRLVTEHQGRKVPTVGGMILFGKDRERHFPDAWIQAGRFQGINKSHIVDRTEIRSIPARAVEEAIAFVHKHALHGADIGVVRRRSDGACPLSRSARRSSMRSRTPTTLSVRAAAHLHLRRPPRSGEPRLVALRSHHRDLQRGVSKLRNRVIGPRLPRPRPRRAVGSGIHA